MANFDPDAYLAAKPAAFDPDAYLSSGKAARAAANLEADKKLYAPTNGMSGFDKFAAGIGKAGYDTVRGIGQIFGQVSQDDVAESRKLDESLIKTGAGMAGNIAGNVAILAPTAMIPGANTLAGAGAIGALTGFAQPSVSNKEVLVNTLLGGAGGSAGQAVANKLPGMVTAWAQGSKQKAIDQTAATAQKFAAAEQANKLGYVIPPADLNPGVVSEVVSGLSGKIKTAQVASQRNQSVTDNLARKALGIADDAPINLDALNTIRQRAGQSYEAVSSLGTINPTPAYSQALDDAVKSFTSSANSFPGRKIPAVVEDIQSLKTGAFDAGDAINTIKVLRNEADAAYRAGNKLEGKAYKDAVDALESAIDTHMVTTGAPADLLKNYRDARQTIAKTYTVQKALNAETGNISAPKLASELTKGKPLSGELLEIAQAGQAFPKSMQALKESPKQISPLDFAVAAGLTGGTLNPLMMATLGIRPLARNALLSSVAQKSMLTPGFKQSLSSRVAQPMLDNELVRLLGGPTGIIGGLGAGQAIQQ